VLETWNISNISRPFQVGYEAWGSNYHCGHQQNWQSQNITLAGLKEVEIKKFKASEDEVNRLELCVRMRTAA
jgi:hypothetical protein